MQCLFFFFLYLFIRKAETRIYVWSIFEKNTQQNKLINKREIESENQ